MATVVRQKTPQGVLDYPVRFASWLSGGETISTANAFVTGNDSVLVVDTVNIIDTGQTAEVWLSGGTIGQSYTVEVEVVTNNPTPRTTRRSFLMVIVDDRFVQE